MNFKSLKYLLYLFFIGLISTVVIGAETIQFSADTYQKGPQGEEYGRIYVGNNQTRSEMTQNNQTKIMIVDTENRVSRLLIPAQKIYMEQKSNVPKSSPVTGGEVNPCQGIQGAQCKRLGQEDVAGRSATKWEMINQFKDKTFKSTLWIDTARDLLLRRTTDNGESIELSVVGPDTLGGRTVEKWKVAVEKPGKPVQYSYRWYDAELNLDIREELAGGYVRELRNIKLGPQDARLFELPAGYTRVSPQQQPARR
ncbi:MAG: DUF4412 domain-containing protein [Gammaproteobacteria bacterium]|nr:DUF4412 domain-containing protein [Gammaproteobacteria bacterium]